jgi:hypothetical protein
MQIYTHFQRAPSAAIATRRNGFCIYYVCACVRTCALVRDAIVAIPCRQLTTLASNSPLQRVFSFTRRAHTLHSATHTLTHTRTRTLTLTHTHTQRARTHTHTHTHTQTYTHMHSTYIRHRRFVLVRVCCGAAWRVATGGFSYYEKNDC